MTLYDSNSRPVTDIIAAIMLLCVAISCGTGKQMRLQESNAAMPTDSVLVDSDGNRYVAKQMTDSTPWMTTNLKLTIPASYCYKDVEANCELYGRLYTWSSAQKGCSLLGAGWRLPGNGDWPRLLALYGGMAENSTVNGKNAYKTLLYNGTSGFNALLGGGRSVEGEYSRINAHGFYWTITGSNDSTAWFSNFASGAQALFLQDEGEKQRAFSVRCVKSIPDQNKHPKNGGDPAANRN